MKHLLLLLIFVPCLAAAQVTLQPWTQLYGTVPGQKLGAEVKGILPTANLPYKASIYSFGKTGVYSLQTQTDTGARQIFFGNNMQTGDLNDDGFTDIVVSRIGGSTFVDTVVIYWGTSTSIDTLNPLRITGENSGDAFQPVCIGDVNNDGRKDLIISAGDFPHPFGRGKVYIYLNPVTGSTTNGTILGDTVDSGLGTACAIGDLNNDGFQDLILRGWNQLGPIPQRYDYINIYWGVGNDTLNLTLGRQLRGYNVNSRGLACFDANGDGIDDLLWTNKDSAQIRGDVWVHFEGLNFSSTPNMKLLNPTAPTFGSMIIDAGDMNGDNYRDIAVGAFSVNQTDGLVFVFGGGPRIDSRFDAAVGMDLNSNFGWSVSGLGDVTGDGLGDIIVGAPAYAFREDMGYWGIFKGDTTIRVTAVREGNQQPSAIVLHEAYPNPFNPRTTIEYDLAQRAFVTLKVYNVLGQEIQTLVNREQEAGQYSVQFDAKGLAAGTYFYKLTVRTATGKILHETKKMILLSAREKMKQDEYEHRLLTQYRSGDDAALQELGHLQYQRTGGRLKRFLLSPAQPPDTIIYEKDMTIYFYDKDITRLKEILL